MENHRFRARSADKNCDMGPLSRGHFWRARGRFSWSGVQHPGRRIVALRCPPG